MTALLPHGLLIAQASRVDEMARRLADGFREDPVRFEGGVWWVVVLIVVGLLPAVWILGRLTGRWQSGAARSSPGRLFASLCRAHGLSWPDRWLLGRLALFHALSDPARLFLEPERFDPRGLDPRLRKWERRLQAIRSRLFAGLSEEDWASPQGGRPSAEITAIAAVTDGRESPPDSPAVSTATLP